MTSTTSDDAIQITAKIYAPVEDVFRRFVEQFAEWWPREYTFAGDDLLEIGIENRMGGRCFERDRSGVVLVWGEVTTWEPPHKIVFSWWISPQRQIEQQEEHASEVDVIVRPSENGAQLELTHRHLSRHSGDWKMMRDMMASKHGWPYLIRTFLRESGWQYESRHVGET